MVPPLRLDEKDFGAEGPPRGVAAVRERLRQYAASRPHPATPRNVAGATQAVKVAAPAPALALGAPVASAQAECGCCTTAVTCRSCRSGFSGYCMGGFCSYVSGFSYDCIIRNSGIRGVSGGNSEIRDAACAASSSDSQSERSNCGQKPSPQSQSGPCEARRRETCR
jgi:hypothetical protein